VASGDWSDLDSWRDALTPTSVPDASLPLMTHLLHVDTTTRGSCLLVSFPVGWERGPGTYACAEHAVVLDGSIELDGERWSAGQGFVVPAGAQRTRTYAPMGALAVAWFAGKPEWTGGITASGPPSSREWNGHPTASLLANVDEVDVNRRQWRHRDEADRHERQGVVGYVWGG